MGQVYSHIGEEERQVIRIEVGDGTPIRAMAAMLSRSPSSVSREIKRNTWFASNQNESYRPYRPQRLKTGPWTGRHYVAGPARRKAAKRARLVRKPRRMACARLEAWVEGRLRCGFSPLLISGKLRLEYPDDPVMRVCPESVYQWIYATERNRERLAGYLPRAHRRRRKRHGGRAHGSPIGMRVGLAERAADIDSRTAFGHWQADSVIGMGRHMYTEVERKTRHLRAMLIPDKTSAATLRAQYAPFSGLPEQARASVTMDNGTEFSAHAALLESPGTLTYFADPHGSWQRGSNENCNGMIRRYLPKGTTIGMDMADEIQMIVDEINNKPMRIPGYRTPAEAWTDELLALNQQQRRCTCT